MTEGAREGNAAQPCAFDLSNDDGLVPDSQRDGPAQCCVLRLGRAGGLFMDTNKCRQAQEKRREEPSGKKVIHAEEERPEQELSLITCSRPVTSTGARLLDCYKQAASRSPILMVCIHKYGYGVLIGDRHIVSHGLKSLIT